MPWTLNIHTLDVGQGEASLIVASDPTLPAQRSILIDGAHASYARIIQNYVVGPPAVPPPGVLIVTHYDVDHSGGVMALLRADNLWCTSDGIAAVAQNYGVGWATRPQQIAAATAAATAAAWGAYGANAAAAGAPSFAAQHGAAGMNDANAAAQGVAMARQFLPYSTPATPTLFPTNGTLVTRAASNGGVACANGLGMGHADGVLRGDIRAALRTVLQGCLPAVSRFDTRGSYRAVTVLDVGDIAHTPAQYPGIVAGHFTTTTGYLVQGIGTNRARITPALGREVLFNTGAGAGPPPAGAPAAVVVARRARAWQGVGVPAVGFQSNEPDNDQSIGLVVRFDQFSFFSGGDLPSQGEDPIATAVTATGLPDPGGGTYPVPADIPCGKCSHHGAATATSQAYLNTAQPTGAIISCGPTGKHGHPTNTVVNRLHAQATVAWFYLTNDGVNNVNVARTQGADQLLAVGNKSRVAGDNNPTNRNALRDRGDIVLSVTAAQAANAMRQYTVRYWDEDLPGGAGLRPENTNF